MSIEVIGLKSPHLPTVKALGKANAATLGFLPEGAFNDYAAKRTIIGAIDSTGKCVGYLLYRATGNQVTIAHLCVDKTTRQQGIAAELIKYLKEISKDFSSITLKCRRDYEAAKVWSRFGFIPLKDIPGRGRKASFLTYWKYDYGHPNMFTSVATEDLRTKLCVVMDANVFFDLCDPSRPGYEESSALLADWLPENLELCLTDEIYNDLNSSEDADQRKCGRENAKISLVSSVKTKNLSKPPNH
jgi:predicted GNAT family acetyltransferase